MPILFLLLSSLAVSCKTSSAAHEPEWVHQPTRTVDNGYIVYIGHGEGPNAEAASFRAEGAALEDLANECSMIPKGARTEDHFVEKTQTGASAYAKVAIEFQQCQQAQKTTDPETIKKIANASYTSQLKRYQDYEETGFMPEANEGPGIEPPLVFAEAPIPGPFWNDSTHFYATRQYVAYQKELVILSPPHSYAPGSLESRRFRDVIVPATQSLVTLQSRNPSLAIQPRSWSQWKDRPQISRPSSLAPGGASRPELRPMPRPELRSNELNSRSRSEPGLGKIRKKRRRPH